MEEEAAIGFKAFELKKQGKLEEYERMLKQIPLQPYLEKTILFNFINSNSNYFRVETFYLPYSKKNEIFDTVKCTFGKCEPHRYRKQAGNNV